MTHQDKLYLAGLQGILDQALWELTNLQGRAPYSICRAIQGIEAAIESLAERTGCPSTKEKTSGQ